VNDDDPGRNEFGIMRFCERALKRRGVNVYPSLIPSMQRLTARGMMLANHFRSLGVPVIESYPGAAQDIMGIPRKRASLEYLARGLQLFGIDGKFDYKTVTHDELDAITSAIVGQFFWSGKYEGLGNENEEYLIIPDLKANVIDWRKRKVIGLSGPIATGKTTAANYIKSLGFEYSRYSQVLKQMLAERGIEASRTSLQEIGDEVNKSPGQRWLCMQLIKMLPERGNLVIDGLRHPDDHAYMVENYGPAFIHVHIESSESNRANRYVADGNTEEEFKIACNHHVEMEIDKLAPLADVIICNDGDIAALEKSVAQLVRK
jgi:predicted nuclease with RNAse H fold/dephospho-CoA kinase